MTDGMTIEEMKDTGAYTLADMASCGQPDSLSSPGARMLESVRDSVVDMIGSGSITLDDFNDDGQISGIADDAPNVYTHGRWQQFVDLTAYEEEPEFSDEWPKSLTEAAGIALYQIADRLAHALCEAWRAGWECPTCGEEVDGPSGCTDTDGCGNPAGALVALVTERMADVAEAESVAEPLPVRTRGQALAEVIGADSEPLRAVYVEPLDGALGDLINDANRPDNPAEAVLTGPVDLGAHQADPLWTLLHQADQTNGEIRAARMGMAHERAVSRFRRKVWTVTGILAVFAVSAVVIFLG